MNALPDEDLAEGDGLLVFIEMLETFAEGDLNRLLEMDEYERVARIIERLQEKLPKRIT